MPRSSPLLLSLRASRSVRGKPSPTRTMTSNGLVRSLSVPTTRLSSLTSIPVPPTSGFPTHPGALDVQESTPIPLPLLPPPSLRAAPSLSNMVMVPPSLALSSRIPVSLFDRVRTISVSLSFSLSLSLSSHCCRCQGYQPDLLRRHSSL